MFTASTYLMVIYGASMSSVSKLTTPPRSSAAYREALPFSESATAIRPLGPASPLAKVSAPYDLPDPEIPDRPIFRKVAWRVAFLNPVICSSYERGEGATAVDRSSLHAWPSPYG